MDGLEAVVSEDNTAWDQTEERKEEIVYQVMNVTAQDKSGYNMPDSYEFLECSDAYQ